MGSWIFRFKSRKYSPLLNQINKCRGNVIVCCILPPYNLSVVQPRNVILPPYQFSYLWLPVLLWCIYIFFSYSSVKLLHNFLNYGFLLDPSGISCYIWLLFELWWSLSSRSAHTTLNQGLTAQSIKIKN